MNLESAFFLYDRPEQKEYSRRCLVGHHQRQPGVL
jgi:hypothetical protein